MTLTRILPLLILIATLSMLVPVSNAAKTYNLSKPKPAATTTPKTTAPVSTVSPTQQSVTYPWQAPTATPQPVAKPVPPQATYPWQIPSQMTPSGNVLTGPSPTSPSQPLQPQLQPPTTTISPFTNNYQAQQQQAVQDAANSRNVLLILDASDSMNEPMEGSTKFEIAKRVLIDTLRKIPPDVKVGLRVYGHRRVSSRNFFFGNMVNQDATCKVSDLLVPMTYNNRNVIETQISSLQATGLTPITYSLQQAQRDFSQVEGKKMIILVSDGRDTCANADPCDAALSMVRNGSNVKINTIGFDLHDAVAQDQLQCVALSTKGKFFSADTSGELADSLNKSIQSKAVVRARVVD